MKTFTSDPVKVALKLTLQASAEDVLQVLTKEVDAKYF